MQEFTTPGEVTIDPAHNATTALFEHARTHPHRPAVAHRVGSEFVTWTTKQFTDEIVAVAKGLIGLGIEAGSKICIMSDTRLEWTILDYAIWAAGCVPVPIYETSSAEQVEWIISDSGAVGIMCADDHLKSIYDEVADKLPDCQHVYVIDNGGLEEIKSHGTTVSDDEVEARRVALTGDDIATLVYTSGTTGRPKGCIITHGNFVWEMAQVLDKAKSYFYAGESTLLFLPLAHIFARLIQSASITAGVIIYYSTGIPQLLEELQMAKPSILLAVPRVFEKVFNGAQQRAHGEGKGKIFDLAAQVAVDYSREQQEAGRVGLKTKLLHAVFDKLVYAKLRAAVGGNLRYAISGGAALGDRLGHFFRGVGITILEGYGLTETTAGACLNDPEDLKIGTVGRPMPGASVRIAEDGEILIKGGHVFRGYYNNDEATKEAIDADGWFRTGDVGQVDDDGYVRITGRKKELIVTAGGKNVAPAVLEDRIRSHYLVSQAMVVGDGEPFIAALITIDAEAFATWAAAHGKTGKSVADLVDDEDLKAEVQAAVDDANKAVSKAEAVRTLRILPEDFEVGIELSQKQSVKRHVVSEKYADVISEIYAGVQKMR
jgi:long-chain acyl-CoA synthetase